MAYVLGIPGSEAKKWALFDLDWTLIRPTCGKFCNREDDWKIIPGRIERLMDFTREGYSIGTVSNQTAKGKRLVTVNKRMENVYNELKKYFPDIVMMWSTEENEYRKPGIGWSKVLKFLPGSLFAGDACRDLENRNRSVGYSDSDREFAMNMGLPFFSIEEVFPQIQLPEEMFRIPKVVLVLVGPPGSGKSFFRDNILTLSILNRTNIKATGNALRKHFEPNWRRVIRLYWMLPIQHVNEGSRLLRLLLNIKLH